MELYARFMLPLRTALTGVAGLSSHLFLLRRAGSWASRTLRGRLVVTPRVKTHLELCALALIIAFAVYVTMLPRLDFRYPIHVDEWLHYGRAQATLEAGDITYQEPFFGRETQDPYTETSFDVFLAELRLLTGLDWLSIFRVLPSLLFVFVCINIYLLCRRWGCGLEAALLVILIPTTLRFLGPGFLVPVGMGLLVLPTVLLLIHTLEFSWKNLALLVVLLSFLFTTHASSSVLIASVIGVHLVSFLFSSDSPRRHRVMVGAVVVSGGAILAVTAIFLAGFSIDQQAETVLSRDLVPQLPLVTDALIKFGYVPVSLALLGVVLLGLHPNWKSYGMIGATFILVGLPVLYSHYLVGDQRVADRAWLYFMMFLAILGGYTLGWLRQVSLSRTALNRPWTRYWNAPVKYVAIGVVLTVSLVVGLRQHQQEPYYRIVDDQKYRDWTWISSHVADSYVRGVLEPTFGIAFAPLSGKYTFTNSSAPIADPPDLINKTLGYLREGNSDTLFLRASSGSEILYRPKGVRNPDLVLIRPGVYLLSKDYPR